MCGDCPSIVAPSPDGPIELSRRSLLFGMSAAVALAATPRLPTWGESVRVRADLSIRPRSDWGGDLVPGPLQPENDVRFLLVHHTAGSNDYREDQVISQLRGVFDFHTSAEKGWSDVAYNFFVDRYGGVWEGRAGSLAGPVMADATGGSQGFAQLVCLPGNFMEVPPTEAMVESLSQLLAFLADRYGISTEAGSAVTFTSRGSNRWPAGAEVTGRTISGHRDMSATACPGDFVYSLLETAIPDRVRALRGGAAPVLPPPAAPPLTAATTPPATTPPTAAPATSEVSTTPSTTEAPATTQVPTSPPGDSVEEATTGSSPTATSNTIEPNGEIAASSASAPATSSTAAGGDGSSSDDGPHWAVFAGAMAAAVAAIGGSVVTARRAWQRGGAADAAPLTHAPDGSVPDPEDGATQPSADSRR